jgi:hypothetical protein
VARKALAEMVNLSPDKPGFGAALDSVKAGIAHHVNEEESEVFPKHRKEGQDVLAQVVTPFMHERVALELHRRRDGQRSHSDWSEALGDPTQGEAWLRRLRDRGKLPSHASRCGRSPRSCQS